MAEEEKVIYSIEVHSSDAVRNLTSVENKISSVGKRMKEVFTAPFTKRQTALGRLFGIDESYASRLGLTNSSFTEINRERWITNTINPLRRHLKASYMREMLAIQNAWKSEQTNRGKSNYGRLLLGYTPAWSDMARTYSSYIGSLAGMRRTGGSGNRMYPISPFMLPSIFGELAGSQNQQQEEIYGNDPRAWTRGGSRFRNMRYWANALGYTPSERVVVDTEGEYVGGASGGDGTRNNNGGGNGQGGGRWNFFRNLWSGFQQYVPRGAGGSFLRNILGGTEGGMPVLRFIGAIAAAGAALSIFTKTVKYLLSPLTQVVDEVFAFYRTRHMNGGLNNGELTQIGVAGVITGGSRESNYALMNKISSERAGLFWGGSGGSMMEAASRFGVDIRGSGEGGLATNKEYLRAIAARMSELSPSGKLALANAAGLNREQMWMVSHGTSYFDAISNFRSPASYVWGGIPGIGNDTYTENFQEESQNFFLDWAIFSETFKEFVGSISEVLIPVVNFILEILTGIFAILNLVLKPISTVLGKILSLLNISHYQNMAEMEKDLTSPVLKDYGLIRGMESGIMTEAQTSVQVGSINVTTNATDPDGVAQAIGEHLNGWFADIYNAKSAGYERCA